MIAAGNYNSVPPELETGLSVRKGDSAGGGRGTRPRFARNYAGQAGSPFRRGGYPGQESRYSEPDGRRIDRETGLSLCKLDSLETKAEGINFRGG